MSVCLSEYTMNTEKWWHYKLKDGSKKHRLTTLEMSGHLYLRARVIWRLEENEKNVILQLNTRTSFSEVKEAATTTPNCSILILQNSHLSLS